jgi:hypothetical protein
LRCRHPGIHELLSLDRKTAVADVDVDASGLLPLLIQEITNDHDGDDKYSDHKVEKVTIHGRMALIRILTARSSDREKDPG